MQKSIVVLTVVKSLLRLWFAHLTCLCAVLDGEDPMPRDPWSHAMMFLRATLFLDQPLKSKQLCTFVTILLVALIAGCKGTGQAIPEPLPADVLD